MENPLKSNRQSWTFSNRNLFLQDANDEGNLYAPIEAENRQLEIVKRELERIKRLPEDNNDRRDIIRLINKLYRMNIKEHDRRTHRQRTRHERTLRQSRALPPTSSYLTDAATKNFLDELTGPATQSPIRSRSQKRRKRS